MMERRRISLTAHDMNAVMASLPELYRAGTLDDFPERVFGLLRALIPADSYAYDEMVPQQRRALCMVYPEESRPVEKIPVFAQFIGTHPIISRWGADGAGPAMTTSDLVSRKELENVPIYAEFYRGVHVHDQLALMIDFPKPTMVGLACNRDRRTFTDRDRQVLNLLGPHLRMAYENAVLVSRSPEIRMPPGDGAAVGTVTVTASLRMESLTARARTVLATFFPGWGRRARSLPVEIVAWLRQQGSAAQAGQGMLRPEMVVHRGALSLVVRLAFNPAGEGYRLLLTRRGGGMAPLLTVRQTELLELLMKGASAKEAAAAMGVSVHTVNDHMKALYVRLNVSSRGELFARVAGTRR